MIPISAVSIVSADTLRLGDFAFIHDLRKFAVIGQVNGTLVYVVLDEATDWMTGSVGELLGYATKIDGWEIQVEPLSLKRMEFLDDRMLALTVSRVGTGLVALPPSKLGHVNVIINDVITSETGQAFEQWKIVRRDGERIETFFERRATQ